MERKRRPSRLFTRGEPLGEDPEELEVTATPDSEEEDHVLDSDGADHGEAVEIPTQRIRPPPPIITEVSRSRPPTKDEDAEAEIYLAMEFARRRSARPGLPTDPGNQGMDTMSLGENFGTAMSEVPDDEGDLGSFEGRVDIEVPDLDPDIAREIAESRQNQLTEGSPSWITEDGDAAKDDMDEVTPLEWSQHPELPANIQQATGQVADDVEDDDTASPAGPGGSPTVAHPGGSKKQGKSVHEV